VKVSLSASLLEANITSSVETQTTLDQNSFLEKFGYGKGFSGIARKDPEFLPRREPEVLSVHKISSGSIDSNPLLRSSEQS